MVVDLAPHSKFFDNSYLAIFSLDSGDASPAQVATNLLEPGSSVSGQDSDGGRAPAQRLQEEPGFVNLDKLRVEDLALDQVRSAHETAAASRKGGLGNLYFCRYSSVELKVRDIKIADISAYVLRQMTEEIKDLTSGLQVPFVERPCKLLSDKKAQYLISVCAPDYEPLDRLVKQRDLGLKEKVAVMALAAKVLAAAGRSGRGYHHGHLSPGNISVGGTQQVHRSLKKIRILDLGFTFLKKYASLLAGYSNKSCYTAPEKLVTRGNVIEAPSQEADVYSFSLVLW